MKIAFALFKYFSFGGLQLDTANFIREAVRRGHEVTLFVAEIQDNPDIPGAEIIRLPLKKHSSHARALEFGKLFHQAVREKGFDITLAMNRIRGCDFYFAADNCIADEFEKKHCRLIRQLPRYRIFADIERSIFAPESPTRILYIAEPQKTAFIRRYHTQENRFFPLPPGIHEKFALLKKSDADRAVYRDAAGISPDEFMLISVAANFKLKGIDRAIAVIAEMPPEIRKKIRYFVVGPDDAGTMLPLVKKYALMDNVVFTGARSDTGKLLAAADLMLHLPYSEAAGTVIAESLAAGTPVLCSQNCGFAAMSTAAGCPAVSEKFSAADTVQSVMQIYENLSEYRKKVQIYAEKTDFFSRAAKVADLLEAGPNP